jgi:DNA-binding CsgD family transcriptional regulator
MPWRSAAACAWAALGETAAARELVDEALALTRSFGTAAPVGVALRARAVLEPAAARVETLEEAVELLGRSQARLEHAHALCDLGTALRHARSPKDAREPLRVALDESTRCGAIALARRAHGELLAAGARPRHAALFGRDALTPAERRAVQLAADGLTNRQIAQTLFVTTKTVETHLARAYHKLDVRSRRELAAALSAADAPTAP